MLELDGICFRYPNKPWLFNKLTFAIHPGEIVGIFGYSGSGKTTMAQMMAGYIKPYEGRILVDGHPLPKAGISPVQLVWQHPEKAVNPKWRMKEILAESGNIDNELLETLGIKKEWLNRWPSELSGGELQRFCVARALGKETNYLIADEMTTMLDAITQAQLWHAVIDLAKKRNIGVLAISHDYHLLQRISDRIVNFDELKHKT